MLPVRLRFPMALLTVVACLSPCAMAQTEDSPTTAETGAAATAAAALAFVDLPAELLEGASAPLRWELPPGTASVALVATAEPVAVPAGSGRARVEVLRQPGAPSDGGLDWSVPWLDTVAVTLKLKAFAADGGLLGMVEEALPYRPAALADKRDDGIYIWLSGPHGQRLYYQQDGVLQAGYACSGSRTQRLMPEDSHPYAPHDHHGVFEVRGKTVDHYSSLNRDWRMQYVLWFHNGHAVHATTPNFYSRLGRPASHGCVRLHLDDAKWLYRRAEPGTRVEVF